MEKKSNKIIVLETYRKIIRDLDLSLIDNYVSENYIQHSPTVKDGREGLLEMLTFLKTLPKPKDPQPSPIIRTIAEDELVAVHLDVTFMGKQMTVVDLFRLKGGLICEHWDAGQAITNIKDSIVTMTNGSTVIDPNGDSNSSKKLIKDFYKELLNLEDQTKAKNYFAENYIEHNTSTNYLVTPHKSIIVHKLIAEGDFVVAHCESVKDDCTYACFDIFRIVNSKIAEHWSVEQKVPDKMAHGNGMF